MENLSSQLASLRIERDARGVATPRRGPRRAWRVVGAGVLGLGVLGLSVIGLSVIGLDVPGLDAAVGSQGDTAASLLVTSVQTEVLSGVDASAEPSGLTATGYVVAERRSRVAVDATGRVASVRVARGSQVTRADVLAELDAEDERGRLREAETRLAAARARVATSEAAAHELRVQLARQQVLVRRGAAAPATEADLDARAATARATVHAAVAEVEVAQATLASARQGLAKRTVRAPIDGVVLERPLDVGEAITPDSVLLELADLRSLVVEVDVPEARLPLARVAGAVEVTVDAFGAQRFAGRVRELGTRLNRAKGTLTVQVALDALPPGLLPDMAARARFVAEAARTTRDPELLVSERALASRGGRRGVFVVDDGRARFAPVQLGEKRGAAYRVRDGVGAGARVVMEPGAGLESGQKVRVRE